MTIEEIKSMKSTKFKHIVKLHADETAFEYLVDKQKQGKKGKLITYKQMEMAD